MATYNVQNKVALVTGGGSGIGEACAMTLAQSGAKVCVSDLNADNGQRVVSQIRDAGGEALFVKTDVTTPSDVEAMVAEIVATFGRLEIAVNNAGISGEQNMVGDLSIAGWHQIIDVNLNSVFYCMHYQIPRLLDAGGGAIVNVASILGSVGFAGYAGYVAAKHGVVGLTRTAALEYSAKGIRVNAVGPGFIKTPLLAWITDLKDLEAIAALHPIGRMGQPQEVANLVAFLASDDASFITGGYYVVDGAYTAQ